MSSARSQNASTISRRVINPRVLLHTFVCYAWLITYLIILVLVLGPVFWVTGRFFDKYRTFARRTTQRFYQHFLRHFCGRFLTIDSFDFSAAKGSCIVVANHQSMMDMMMIMQLNIDTRAWSKGWPFRVPLLGWLMHLCGHMLTDDYNLLPDAQDSLSIGISLCSFPEGTRTRSGRVGRFRDGAFLLAVKTGRPIVPVAIHGTFDCLRPQQGYIFLCPLRVQPLGVLWPAANDPKAHLILKRQARDMIIAALRNQVSQKCPRSTDEAASSANSTLVSQ